MTENGSAAGLDNSFISILTIWSFVKGFRWQRALLCTVRHMSDSF